MGPALLIGIAGGLTVIGQISKGETPHPRVFLGVFIAGAGVLAIAQWSPELAQKFAGVVLTTSLLTSGYDASKGAARALNR